MRNTEKRSPVRPVDTHNTRASKERIVSFRSQLARSELRTWRGKEGEAERTLNRVIKGQDVNTLSVLDVVASVNGGNVSELDAKVVASD